MQVSFAMQATPFLRLPINYLLLWRIGRRMR